MLILSVSENFDKLFQYRRLAPIAPLCKLCRIVIVTVNLSLVFIIAVLRAKNCWTDRASEMLDVVFAIQGSDIGAAKSTSAIETQEIEATEVVSLAQRILSTFILFIVDREEFGSNNVIAVLFNLVE